MRLVNIRTDTIPQDKQKTKVCGSCGSKKNIEDFEIKKQNIDGRSNQCQTCQKEKNDARYKIRKQDLIIDYNERNPFDWCYEN